MINQAYETRIVAYGDILGWSDKCCKDGDEFEILFKAANGIALHADGFSPQAKNMVAQAHVLPQHDIEEHAGREFSHFSDNFAISALIDHGETVFKTLSWRITNLLQNGFLVRGGVTVGDLYHCPKIIFGPALVEAVKIEKEVACFPRFLCSEGLIEYLDGTLYKNQVVLQDCYEDWVVNTWCGLLPLSQSLLVDLMRITQKNISVTNGDIRQKWLYMKRMLPRMYELTGAPSTGTSAY